MNIMEVKAYLEKAKLSTSNKTFKIAVLKVRYEDGSSEIIFRQVLKNKMDMYGLEKYKDIDLNQVKQISNIINEEQKPIFDLYLNKYLKSNLNIDTYSVKRNIKLGDKTKGLSLKIKQYLSA